MADFFISFNKNDRKWAAWIAWTLRDAGYSVIFQDWDFRPGEYFGIKMHEALRSSKRMIAVLSQSYLDAMFTYPEWTTMFAQDPKGAKRKLVPVKVGACDPDGLLTTLIHLDLIGLRAEEAKTALLNGLEATVTPVRGPFPGPSDEESQAEGNPGPPEPAPPEPVAAEPASALPKRPWVFPGSKVAPLLWAIWNGVLMLLALAGAIVWMMVYTGWRTAIEVFFTLFAAGAGIVIAAFFPRRKDGAVPISAKWLASPWWLTIPAAVIVFLLASLFWATISLQVVQKDAQYVVFVRGARETGVGRRATPSHEKPAVLRVPLWSDSSYLIGSKGLTERPFAVNRWKVTPVLLPDDLQPPQIYFKPTPILHATIKGKGWRLRVTKNGRDLLPVVHPYDGEGVVVGGTSSHGLTPPPNSTIRYDWPLPLTKTDRIAIFVEVPVGGTWRTYTRADATNENGGTREVSFDAPD